VWYSFGFVVAIVAIAAAISLPVHIPDFLPFASALNKPSIHLGLDLQGGTHLVYEADVSQLEGADRAEALNGVRDVIERRVNAFGVSEPLIQTSNYSNTYRVIAELAGVSDVNQAIKLIGETPLLEFKEQAPTGTAAAPAANEGDIQTKALLVLGRAAKGEDFAKLVNEFSQDTGSKATGGDVGWAKADSQLVPEYKQAILDPKLKAGQVLPQLVRSQYGYHIIKITDVRGSSFDREVRSSHILFAVAAPASDAGNWKNTQLTGKNLKRSAVEFDPNTGQPHVALTFDDQGKQLFADLTKKNIGKPIAIFLDGQAISIPTVQSAIIEGRAIISGSFGLKEAKLLAQRLNAGALPVPINLVSQQTVGPTLGKVAVERSLIAGILGLLAVALFMLIYYRLPGLLAVCALLAYAAVSMAVFEIWPVTLTLAGIAGFILSIGMAVDANVLIFERLREELRNGKPLALAVEDSFSRAWLAIRDSNVSSLITCIILAWFGSGIVKGFAITLAIGIGISMFTAIGLTRTLMRVVFGGSKTFKRWVIGY
jgi:preprotein translocase subunit SecD